MKFKPLIKLGISAVMLLMVLRFVDFGTLRTTLATLPPQIFFLVAAGYIGGQIISSFKWWMIARSGEIDTPYPVALKAYFIGQFVSCFGFGLVGGDLARGMLLANGKPVKAAALASVVADRAQGLAVLLGIGLTTAALIKGRAIPPHLRVQLALIAAAIVVCWFIGSMLLVRLVPKESRFRRTIEQMAAVFPRSPSRILVITLLSVLFHLSQIGLHLLMGQAVGASLTWTDVLIAVPFVNILSNLPFISWNGVGVREGAYLFFFGGAITNEQAVAFGAIWLLAVTTGSAIGGIIAFITGDLAELSRKQKEESAAASTLLATKKEDAIAG